MRGLFALTFLTPDLFMLGYLINKEIGAALYNLVHTVTAPATVLAAGAFASPTHSHRARTHMGQRT